MLPRLPLLSVLFLTTPLALAAPAPTTVADGREPQLAAGPDHRVYLAYGRGNEVHLATSADAGRSFPTDVTLPACPPALSLGMRRGPRVAAAGDGVVLVTAIAGHKGRGQDGDLLAWRSADAGRSFTGPTRVNDVPAAAREGLHALASDGQRRAYAVWLDLRTGRTRLVGALSRDAGLTWEANELIYQSPDSHICECCHPSVTFLPTGQVAVMFRNFLDGNRDMYLATFTPGSAAATGVRVAKLGADSWRLNACPMDGGALTADPVGNVLAVWQSEGKIHLSNGQISPKNGHSRHETTLGDGVQPAVTPLPTGPAVVWTTARTGQLLYHPPTGPITPLAPKATDPVLITSGDQALCAFSADGQIHVTPLPTLKTP